MWLDDPTLQHLNWRRMLMANAAPAVFFWLLAWVVLRESPVFSAVRGRREEALATLDSMRRVNGRPNVDIQFGSEEAQGLGGQASFWDQLPTILTSSTAVLCLVCFSYNLTVYGAFTAFPQLLPQLLKQTHESPVFVLARGAFIEIPGDVFGLVAGLALPRKWVLYGYFAGLGISSLLCSGRSKHSTIIMWVGVFGCAAGSGFWVDLTSQAHEAVCVSPVAGCFPVTLLIGSSRSRDSPPSGACLAEVLQQQRVVNSVGLLWQQGFSSSWLGVALHPCC